MDGGLTWRYHNLMAFRSYSHEPHIVLSINTNGLDSYEYVWRDTHSIAVAAVNFLKPALYTFYYPSNRTSIFSPMLPLKDDP